MITATHFEIEQDEQADLLETWVRAVQDVNSVRVYLFFSCKSGTPVKGPPTLSCAATENIPDTSIFKLALKESLLQAL